MNRKAMTAELRRPRARPAAKRNRRARAAAHAASSPSRVVKSAAKSKPDKSEAAPELRHDKIRRAKRLLESANYPSDEVIESVADLLGRGLRRQRKISVQQAG